MDLTKKAAGGAFEVVTFLLILGVIVGIILAFIILLYKFNTIEIDTRTLDTELVLNKLTREDCFSTQYGVIKEDSYTQKALDDCLEGLNNNKWVLIQVEKEKSYYAFSKGDEFKQKQSFCFKGSSILCTQAIYPITYIDSKGQEEVRKLTVQVLVS